MYTADVYAFTCRNMKTNLYSESTHTTLMQQENLCSMLNDIHACITIAIVSHALHKSLV